MKNLTTAIFAKCSAATTLYASVGGRLYKGIATPTATFPYIVYTVVSDVSDPTFTDYIEDVTIQFSLYSTSNSSTEVEDIFTYLKDLYDNCTLTITGNTFLFMERGHASLMVEEWTTASGTENVWHYAVDYNIMMVKS